MEKKANELSERFLLFGAAIFRLVEKSSTNQFSRHIGMQLFRSATSVGANYEEARGAESRQDFTHKMQISLKEARESLYWLRLSEKTGIMKAEKLSGIIEESQQLCEILGKSIKTLKSTAKEV